MGQAELLLRQARERNRRNMESIVSIFGMSSEEGIKATEKFHEKWVNEQQKEGLGDGK